MSGEHLSTCSPPQPPGWGSFCGGPCMSHSFLIPQTITEKLLSAGDGGDTTPAALWWRDPGAKLCESARAPQVHATSADRRAAAGRCGNKSRREFHSVAKPFPYLRNDPNSVRRFPVNKQRSLSRVATELKVRNDLSQRGFWKLTVLR